MTAETINCRNLQNGFVIRDWPLSDWNLHDDLYKAGWEILTDDAEPEAPVEAPAAPEQPSDAEPADGAQAPAQDA